MPAKARMMGKLVLAKVRRARVYDGNIVTWADRVYRLEKI
jgi:hypothetical protein